MSITVALSTTEIVLGSPDPIVVQVSIAGMQGPIGPSGIAHADPPLVYDGLSQTLDFAYGTGLTLDGQDALVPDFGTGAGKVTQGNDARLADERTPVDGSVTDAKIVTGGLSPSSTAGTAVVEGDPRLTDARTPVAGSVTDSGIVAGGLSPSSTAGTAVVTTDPRLSDTRTPTPGSVVDASIVAGGLSPASVAGTAVISTDPRLTDGRTPSGSAGGVLAGTYPNPSLAALGSAGTYTKVTTAADGRVSAGTALAKADIPTIDPSQVAGTAVITSDTRLLPSGGTSSPQQYLGKRSASDFDVLWKTPAIADVDGLTTALAEKTAYADAGYFALPIVAGSYSTNDVGGVSTAVPPEGWELACGFFIPTASGALSRLAVMVITTPGSAGAVVRLGIRAYTASTFKPGALLLDAGTVDCTTTGTKEAVLSPGFDVTAGVPFVVTATVQGAATTRPTMAVCNSSAFPHVSPTAPSANGYATWVKTGVSGALNDTGSFTATYSAMTRMWVKA